MEKAFRKRLINKESLPGTLLSLPNPEIAELLSKSGFDWLFIDLEHSTIDVQSAQHMIQAAQSNAHCILRVPGNEEIWIKRCLDTGAEGIIVPQVNTREEAEQAVRFTKYPPQGKRSVGISKAHNYGITFNQYIQNANDDIALIVQCETQEAIKNLPEILEVKGIDCVFIGPYDLSASMGKTGEVQSPEVVDAIRSIQEQCSKKNMPLGIFGGTPEAVKKYKDEGYNLIAVGIDVLMIYNSAKEIIHQLKD